MSLADRIENALRGHETWRVMNRANDGYCMEFASPEYFNPERACDRWLAEQNPEWIECNGYHAVKSFEFTTVERMALDAAKALRAALAAHPEPQPVAELIVRDGDTCTKYLRRLPDGAYVLYASPPPAAQEPDMRSVCEALGFDPTNHHNAAKCPYCRPQEPAHPVGQEDIERLKFGIKQAMIEYGSAYKNDHKEGIRETTSRCCALLDSLAILASKEQRNADR